MPIGERLRYGSCGRYGKWVFNPWPYYSEADRNAPHVLFADEAVCLGPAPSSQSYLNGDKIIAFAKELGVDGIHPGYGFLSENAEFAKKVEEAGINFIGPGPEAMRINGFETGSQGMCKEIQYPHGAGY